MPRSRDVAIFVPTTDDRQNRLFYPWLLGSLYEAILLLCVHAQSYARHVHLATPMINLVVSLRAYERRHPSLAPANIEDLGFVHLLLLSYKHLLLVPCAWFVDSIYCSQRFQLQMKLTDNVHSQLVSLELNVVEPWNRHRLVNALTMVSPQISWLQSTAPGRFATGGC